MSSASKRFAFLEWRHIFVSSPKASEKEMETQRLRSSVRAPGRPTYRLTRFMILRLLGIVYAVAFWVAVRQILPLIGSDGLTPVDAYLRQIRTALGSNGAGFLRLPSLLWIWHSDAALLTVSWLGFLLSCVAAAGFANALMMSVLWILYMSIVHVGQVWYGYGWEIQLLETGFLAIFLCPLLDPRPFPRWETPLPVIVLFRWLICRVMLGAGLIKLRGDEVWRNSTALYYHFETQPLPGPLSRWFHFLPHPLLKAGVWFNWAAEIASPLFVFWPRYARHIAGAIIVAFQLTLIASGNLSFLNWLTLVPALACFDDGLWSRVLPRPLVRMAEQAGETEAVSTLMLVNAAVLAVMVALLSIQPVMNMLSPRQIMNTSFDPFNLVNTYGAFGSVGKERWNLVVEGTADAEDSDAARWKPYLYKGLPVLLDKRPPQVAPYHLRFDWQMWFAAMASPADYPFTLNLVWKLLHNDPAALDLFAFNPFPDKPPRYIRIMLYSYRYAKPGNPRGDFWTRQKVQLWLPPLSVDNQKLNELKRQGLLR